jgi:2'-5' RNA ligase
VAEAAHAVDPWRERTCEAKPSTGVPPHITLVFPFAPAARLDRALLDALAGIFAAVPAFDFELRTSRRFPAALYLAPEPAPAFERLTDAVVRRFPEFRPYGGAFDSVVPHLTVAQGDDALLDEAEADVRRALPIRALAREALLLEEAEPDGARWRARRRLPLGGRRASARPG